MAVLVHELDLPEVDVAGVELEASLAERRAALERHWLARTPVGYTLSRHADVSALLRDRRWHSALAMIPQQQGYTDPGFMEGRRKSILSTEGEEHARLRRLVAPAFPPRSADRLRPVMRDVVGGLLDAVAPTGRCELVADVCEPYPIPIVCELLGAPKEDWQRFSAWATDIFKIFNGNLAEDAPAIMQANAEIEAYVGELIAERRAAPRDDLLSDLIAIEQEGDRLSTEEMVSLAIAVLMAGTDTTRNQLACSVAFLVGRHRERWQELADDPSLAAGAVEETMRLLGAIRGTARFASEDIEWNNVLFPQGTLVSVGISAANRDADAFPDPEAVDLHRPVPQPHLTFSSGIHFCLGAALARAELQEALPMLAQRLPDLRLDGPVEWKPASFGIWGPAALPLAFTPQPAAVPA
jgi:cytochrome P450